MASSLRSVTWPGIGSEETEPGSPKKWRVTHVKHVTHWIGGKPWTGAASTGSGSGQRGEIYNPATGQVSGTVDFAGQEEVDAAVRAAAAAFPLWRDTSLVKRSAVMFAFRELVRVHAADLAGLISAEHGKVGYDATGEVARGLEVVEFACGIPQLLKGGVLRERHDRGRRLFVSATSRRGGRNHSVQFSGHGSNVDVPDRHRCRQRLRFETNGERSFGVELARNCSPRQGCRTEFSTLFRAARRRSTRF